MEAIGKWAHVKLGYTSVSNRGLITLNMQTQGQWIIERNTVHNVEVDVGADARSVLSMKCVKR